MGRESCGLYALNALKIEKVKENFMRSEREGRKKRKER